MAVPVDVLLSPPEWVKQTLTNVNPYRFSTTSSWSKQGRDVRVEASRVNAERLALLVPGRHELVTPAY